MDDATADLWRRMLGPAADTDFFTETFAKRYRRFDHGFEFAVGLPEIRAAVARHALDRTGTPVVACSDTPGPENPEILEIFDAGGPLIVNNLQKALPRLRDLNTAIARATGCVTHANFYLSRPDGDTLGAHYDRHEVLVWQLAGRKRWMLCRAVLRGAARSPHFNPTDSQVAEISNKAGFDELVLEPGDVLYVPRGMPHKASAAGGSSAHITFGFERSVGLDWVGFLAQLAARDVAFREYLPRHGHQARLEELTVRLQTLATPENVRAFLEAAGLGDEVDR